MAADSIAKLAVIITGDASPLSAALNKAKGDVTGWASGLSNMKSTPFGMVSNDGIDRWATGLRNLKSQEANVFEGLRTGAAKYAVEAERAAGATFRMSMALQAARGNVGAISNLVQSGGLTGGLVAAGVAAGVLAFRVAAISDAQKAATGSTQTWARQFDRVQENAGRIAVTLGRPISEVLARETGQIANILEGISRSIMPEWQRQEEMVLKIMQAQAEAVRKLGDLKERTVNLTKGEADAYGKISREMASLLAKQEAQGHGLTKAEAERFDRLQRARNALDLRGGLREFDKGAEEAAADKFRAMESRAESLKSTLMTAREQFVASLADAGAMFQAGLLNAQDYQRAAEAAAEKFREASKIRDKAQSQAQQGIAATDRFTMAGFSAVQQGQRELQHIEQVAKEQLEEAKRQTEVEQEIAQILNDKLSTPIVLMEGTPP